MKKRKVIILSVLMLVLVATGVLGAFLMFKNEEAEALHIPMHRLRKLTDAQRQKFSVLGASCHSVAEAREAAALGCTYITAGHIFSTDCKKDLKPRGIDFLEEICASVDIPVYAIGGITSQTAGALKTMKIQGVCVMSGFMQCEDPAEYMKELKKGWEK